jgi:hypothetical protein
MDLSLAVRGIVTIPYAKIKSSTYSACNGRNDVGYLLIAKPGGN